jgi:O-antigen/teichoic acid export membrane protein
MAGSSARFITYAIGKGDKESVRDTFCSAMNIHIIIAIVLFIIGETFGLWFVNNKLVIPEERMWVANVIYQFSILSLMLSVTQTPYGACIIAHEKMNIYAYMTILSSVLRLLIVYILVIGLMDKLLLYGILTFCVGVFMIILYRIYCIRHFEESRFRFVWKPEIIKPMLSFSGWDFFGNVAVMGRGTGVDMLINIFFGPAVNAARGVSAHVSSVINQFSGNIIVAVRPQLIKRYASGEHEAMFELMSEGSRFCFILLSFLPFR